MFYFWQAVYQGQDEIRGYTQAMTVSLMVWARLFSVFLTNSNALEHVGLSYFGRLVRDGELAIELLRSVDLQWVSYTKSLGRLLFNLALRLPLVILAVGVFKINFPLSPLNWLQFAVAAFLGYAIIYMFDWALSCLAFFTTATWGLNMVRWGIAAFLGGTLILLDWLPNWFAGFAAHSPFGQALATPLSLSLSDIPNRPFGQIVLEQLFWILFYMVVSRFLYHEAQKTVTIARG